MLYEIQIIALVVIVAYIAWLRCDLRCERIRNDTNEKRLGTFWKRYHAMASKLERDRMWRRMKRKRYAYGYRAGQIDAANGKWKYELRDQPDGSLVWTEIETERGK